MAPVAALFCLAVLISACASKLDPAANQSHEQTKPAVERPPVGTISGVVTDRAGQPLRYAQVSIEANRSLASQTDSAGRYRITNVPPGKHKLEADAVGFTRQNRTVDIRSSEHVELSFILDEEAIIMNDHDDWSFLKPSPTPIPKPGQDSAVLPATIRPAMSARVASQDEASMSAIPARGPTIDVDDVYRFYEVYDAAGGRPTTAQLQDYIDAGSPGLHVFAEQRNITGARIADAIAAHPETYSDARRCMDVLPDVRRRLETALQELGRLYPEARFPPVTIAIGRGKPVGIGSPATGVQIGLEALCATNFLNPDVEDRFVHVIAHEFVHVQQAPALVDGENLTVLEVSLMEGAAEFVAELISGDVAYSHLSALVADRELEIETAFVADQDKTDLSAWVYNTTGENTGDLGYWVGYRIAKAYYRHAVEKRQALREILQLTDAKAFLAASGWRPGITLQ